MANIKRTLGIALFAMLALNAVVASSALATEGVFTPSVLPATIKGSQIGELEIVVAGGVRNFKCNVITSAGEEASLVSSVELAPSYSACTTKPGGGATTVSVGACKYRYTATNKLTSSTGEASLTIGGCGSGKSASTGALYFVAKSTAGSVVCEYEIGSQGPLSAISWENLTDVEMALAVSLSAKVVLGTSVACGAAAGHSVNVEYVGNMTFTAVTGSLLIS